MITPRFKLQQDNKTVTIIIRAPYSNLRELEVTVEENIFIFLSSPYYLRLHLPGQIQENDLSKSSFNADSGEFTFIYEKLIEDEHFPDLDLITKLQSPKIEVKNDSKIIEIDTNGAIIENNCLNQEFGFAMMGKTNFSSISSEFNTIFEIDPRETDLNQRHKLRLQYEQGKFNVGHYLSDFIEDEEITEIMNLKLPTKEEGIKFTDHELDFLKDLPNLEYNLNETQLKYCYCCLIDILFAYCYDRRTTFFEGTTESGWTISKLSASLSWLDGFQDVKEALVSAFRRSLIYPLYRNFKLSETVLDDLKQLLDLGDVYLIKSLIEIYNIFTKSDGNYYIINNLFIKDYIIYAMKWNKTEWHNILGKIKQISVKKEDLGLNLCEIEDGADCKLNLSLLKITDNDSDDNSSDSSDSESSSSSDSSCSYVIPN